MKEYFSHDYGARNDPELVKVRMDMGFEGIGIYWCLVEYLYEQGGCIKRDSFKSAAFTLQVDILKLEKIVESYKLFIIDGENIFSRAILERLKHRKDKSRKAKASINKRWKNQREKEHTNVLQTNYEPNTIKVKESKGKESKVKESKVKNIKEVQIQAVPEKTPGTPQSLFVEGFGKLYSEKTGQVFKANKEHYIIAAKLIKEFGLNSVIEKTRIYAELCDAGDLWFLKDGWADFSVEKLSKFWNKIIHPKTAEQKDSEKWSKLFREMEISHELAN